MKSAFQKALCLGLAVAGFGCGRTSVKPPTEKVRFGLALEIPCTLAVVALECGFFQAEGVEVTVTDYVSGTRALSGMFTGEVDVATVAEVPLAAASFDRQDFAVFASIAKSRNQHRIVARKDAGIAAAADLRGKRAATQRTSSVHLFLDLFLLRHQMSERDMTVSFRKIEELVPALARGEVDAISVREPYTSEAVKALGTNATVLEAPGIYFRTQHIVGNRDFLRQHPGAARGLVRGLLRAERFAQEQTEEAQRLVIRRLGVPVKALEREWPDLYLKVALEQSLLSQLEDEARWLVEGGMVKERPPVNFLRLVCPEPLESEKPEAVTLVH